MAECASKIAPRAANCRHEIIFIVNIARTRRQRRVARIMLRIWDMRGLAMFILIAGIGGGLFLWQKKNEQKAAGPESRVVPQLQSATPKPALTPAPRAQASEYNWMK